MLRSLHLMLHVIGRTLGRIVGFALSLYACAFLALVVGALVAGIQLAAALGGGIPAGLALFWCFVGVIGFYVGPYIIPQIHKAAVALAEEPQPSRRRGDSEPGI